MTPVVKSRFAHLLHNQLKQIYEEGPTMTKLIYHHPQRKLVKALYICSIPVWLIAAALFIMLWSIR